MRNLFYAFTIICIVCSCSCDSSIAKDPKQIANEAGFDLPSYTVISQDDNIERGASAWTDYTWRLKLNEPLSKKDIDKLKKLVDKDSNWSYNAESHTYEYNFDEEGERSSYIIISVDEGTVILDYSWWDFFA